LKFIQDFKENDRIVGHYLCRQKQTLKSRAGKNYLSLRLQDRTGAVDAKVWDMNNDVQDFEEGDFIKIDGVVLTYNNELQMKIAKVRRSENGEYEAADYIPSTDKDIGQLFGQIKEYIGSIGNQYIRTLMENILTRNPDIASAFQIRSAARNLHHSYMGGLLEHTLAVVQICDFMSTQHPDADRDLLIAAAILHDIGKIYELSEFPLNEYTDDGQLLGHIVMGASLVEDEAAKIPGFPHGLATLLRHCVLAHHGEYEFGSPKRPKVLEAFILHCADNMDAKVKAFEEAIAGSQSTWLGFHKMFQRYLRKSDYAEQSRT